MTDRTVPELFNLVGKTAIVTGASSGLAVAFARGVAEAGADVVLGARRVGRLTDTSALVEQAGRRALAVATDVTSPGSCAKLAAMAVDTFGHVDLLVNNAGVGTAVSRQCSASPRPASRKPPTPRPRPASSA